MIDVREHAWNLLDRCVGFKPPPFNKSLEDFPGIRAKDIPEYNTIPDDKGIYRPSQQHEDALKAQVAWVQEKNADFYDTAHELMKFLLDNFGIDDLSEDDSKTFSEEIEQMIRDGITENYKKQNVSDRLFPLFVHMVALKHHRLPFHGTDQAREFASVYHKYMFPK